MPALDKQGFFDSLVDQADRILISGLWQSVDGFVDRSCIRLLSTGEIDSTFVCPANLPAFSTICPLSNGLYVCSTGPTEDNRGVCVLDQNGGALAFGAPPGYSYLDRFTAVAEGEFVCSAVTIGSNGNWTWVGILRLQASGALAATFQPPGTLFELASIAADADGRVYVSGRWEDWNFQMRAGIRRYLAVGALDLSWPTELRANATAKTMTVRSDGDLCFAGSIAEFDGVSFQPDVLNSVDVVAKLRAKHSVGGKARNLSSRGVVAPNRQSPVIVGFVIEGEAPQRVLVRAVSDGLRPFGVAGTLASIEAALYRGATRVMTIAPGSVPTELSALAETAGAFPIADSFGNAVSSLTLPPGAYTLVVASPGSAGGTVLGEIYFLE